MKNLTRVLISIVSAIFLVLTLSGCAEFQSARYAVSNYGQNAADESVYIGRWKHCSAETIGAIKRYYNTPEKMYKYNQFCNMPLDIEVKIYEGTGI